MPAPEELGFRSSAGHWRKRVSVEEIDALWESRPIGRYRGERCMVLDDLGDRMHIAYLGHDLYMARRLGFWEVDRGVFEVVVPRQEIDDLREERSEYELTVDPYDGDPMERDPRDRDPRDWDPRGAGRYAPGPRDTGPFTPPGARPRDPMDRAAMDRGLMDRGLMDTGPSRAADPRAMRDAAWAERDADAAGAERDADAAWAERDADAAWVDRDADGWADRDASAQDPRDTGTWAAVRDADFRESPEPGGPYPRGRGGWRVRDTGGWERPDTGTWDAREIAEMAAREEAREAAAREAAAREAAVRDGRALADTAAWDARDLADTGGWDAREMNGRAPRETRDPADTGGWDAREMGDTGAWDARDLADTGGWQAGETNGRTARDPLDSAGAGGWDARDAGAGNRREVARWDPQETVVWDPVNAGEWDPPARPQAGGGLDARSAPGWEPAEAVTPLQPRTPDAAAVWHGSPAPEDAGHWIPPEPVNMPVTPPRLAIAGAPAPAPPPGPRPDVVRPNPDVHLAAATPIADPVTARNSATPSEYAAIAGRSVGRRSARKTRVTTQVIFSQLLELASIPQSAYAVDHEVDGAMCLIRAKGGYEVFSLADQSRHEVRFFDDEEAAYFYLFGILAAEAVRSGYLGPKTPSGQWNGDSPGGNPPALA